MPGVHNKKTKKRETNKQTKTKQKKEIKGQEVMLLEWSHYRITSLRGMWPKYDLINSASGTAEPGGQGVPACVGQKQLCMG